MCLNGRSGAAQPSTTGLPLAAEHFELFSAHSGRSRLNEAAIRFLTRNQKADFGIHRQFFLAVRLQ